MVWSSSWTLKEEGEGMERLFLGKRVSKKKGGGGNSICPNKTAEREKKRKEVI